MQKAAQEIHGKNAEAKWDKNDNCVDCQRSIPTTNHPQIFFHFKRQKIEEKLNAPLLAWAAVAFGFSQWFGSCSRLN